MTGGSMRRAMTGRSRGIRAASQSAVAARAAVLAAALAAGNMVLGFACGGTTGHSATDLGAVSPGANGDAGLDATLADGSPVDASNAGAFDVDIL
jgi:hypothetical protein